MPTAVAAPEAVDIVGAIIVPVTVGSKWSILQPDYLEDSLGM
jgi:hypothetical protein